MTVVLFSGLEHPNGHPWGNFRPPLAKVGVGSAQDFHLPAGSGPAANDAAAGQVLDGDVTTGGGIAQRPALRTDFDAAQPGYQHDRVAAPE